MTKVLKTLDDILLNKRKKDLPSEVGCEIIRLGSVLIEEYANNQPEEYTDQVEENVPEVRINSHNIKQIKLEIEQDAIENDWTSLSDVVEYLKGTALTCKKKLKDYVEDLYNVVDYDYDNIKDYLKKWGEDVKQAKREAFLPLEGDKDQTLERIMKFEAHLNRQLTQTLHEYERLQGMRVGITKPPEAIDITGFGE